MRRWMKAAAVYAEPQVLAILFLGFSAGIPLSLTGQTLQVWMREQGVSLTGIGLYSLVGLPYVFKFLWAPLVDAVRLPFFSRRFGRRRGWLIAAQLAVAAAIVALGLNDPLAHPVLTAALATLVAFCSATQDIVVDAFRVESLTPERNAAGMANYVAGYRVANLVATAGAFELTNFWQQSGYAGAAGWGVTYTVMAVCIGIGSLAALLAREPVVTPAAVHSGYTPFRQRFGDAVIEPFRDFMRQPHWLAALAFVILFKFGDSFAGVMTAPFVIDIGFDKTEYGRVVKIFGFGATLLGGFIGGYLARALSLRRALLLAAVLQLASNFMFVWLAEAGPQLWLLVLTVAIENLTGGGGTVIFVAYLSGLCRNPAYTATQYALLSALSAVGRTFLASFAGLNADLLGWTNFFLLTVAAAVPGLILLLWLNRFQERKGMEQ